MRALHIALLSLSVCTLLACGKTESPSAIASVNGKPITQAQWNAYLAFKRIKATDAATQQRAREEYLRRAALAGVIETDKLLDHDAMQVEVDEFKKEMLISRYFEKYLDDKVTDQAIKNYYDAHSSEYAEKKVHLAHVLIRLNAKMSAEERQAKLTAAQDAHSQVKAGKDFAVVAAAMSEDQVSGKNGGDLGWLRAGSVDPAFSKRAFELPAGEVSEPFETPFGFHVLKVVEAAQTITKPLEAVQGDIRYQLRAEAKRAEMARLIAKTKIEVDGKPLWSEKEGTRVAELK